jgi:uncharacterized protein YbaP (TraB family)
MRHRLAAATVALLLVTSPIAGQASKNFLWKVEGQGGAVAYLLGSLHVLTAESYPLSETINKAFTDSKVLIEEIDLDETADPAVMMSTITKAMLTEGKTLDQVVAPEVFAEVKRRAEKASLPMFAIQRMKPWLVAIMLMGPTLQAAGFKAELGVDQHFFNRAKTAGMKRQALETLAYQLDRFDELPPALQEDLLKSTMQDLDSEVTGIKEMAQAWSTGNVQSIEKQTLASLQQSPELYKRLLLERNYNWIPHVETCLKEKSGCFIVVGAAHLVGPDGLPALLVKKGYKVTQQ